MAPDEPPPAPATHTRGTAFARGAAVFCAYVALTLLWARFMLGSLATHFAHDTGDPLLNSWVLWWNAVTVPFSSTWWNAPAFFPATSVAAFTESLVGFAPLTSPILWISGNSVLAHNVAVLGSFILSGFCAYLLCTEVTGDRASGFVGGVAFAFAPYRVAQMPHVQVLQACWLPLALFALHRYLSSGQARHLVLFGVAWLLNAWTNGYYLLFLAVLVAGWLLWFVVIPRRWRDLLHIGLVAVVASVPVAAVLWQYKAIHGRYGFARDLDEIRSFSADVAGLANASMQVSLWGWIRRFPRPEGELFPGAALSLVLVIGFFVLLAAGASRFGDASGRRRLAGLRVVAAVLGVLSVTTLGLLAMAGPSRWNIAGVRISLGSATRPAILAAVAVVFLVFTRRYIRPAAVERRVLFYLLAAPALWLLALGPAPTYFGRALFADEWAWVPPYAWLLHLPGFDGLRVPARFWMLTVLCLAVVASYCFSRFAPLAPRRRAALAVLVTAALLSDSWANAMPVVPAHRLWNCERPPVPAASLVMMPVGQGLVDLRAMDLAMQWGMASVNGYSGYIAPHYWAVVYGLAARDHALLGDLAGDGGLLVAVPPRSAAWRQYVASHPRAEQVGTCDGHDIFHISGEGGRTSVPPSTIIGRPARIVGLTSDVAAAVLPLALDGDRRTRWHSGEQDASHWLQADLGESRLITGAVLEGGAFAMDFPRYLTVSVSADERSWDVVWTGATHRAMFTATVRDPARAPVTISIPPREGRYVRFQQSGYDRTYWSVAELAIFAR